MTFLKEVEAIETSDGTLFSKADYNRAVRHEKMVLAGIDYQNIIAGDYLRDWINENQDENVIDLISDPAIVSFATALLVAASDHKQAMNEELPLEAIDGFDCADLDATELCEILSYETDAREVAEAHALLAEFVKAKKANKPKKTEKQPKQPKPEESNETDSLYLEAVEAVRNGDIRPSGKALREKFGIRHDRAGEIMKCMEHDGVVSEPIKGVRTVLV